MILKNNLKELKKVALWIEGRNGNYFKNGKHSRSITIYDATPDEVLDAIEKALSNNPKE